MSDSRVAVVKFGIEVENFLLTPVGRYLNSRAEEEIESAVEELKRVNPRDEMGIRDIQTRIQVCERVLYWLGDAIREGRMAEEQLLSEGD